MRGMHDVNMDATLAGAARLVPYLFGWELTSWATFFGLPTLGREDDRGGVVRGGFVCCDSVRGYRAQGRSYSYFLWKYATATCCKPYLIWA